MIYLKTGIGIELRGDDMLIASIQGNFSRMTFTHFKRITDYRLLRREELREEVNRFFRDNGLSRENVVLGIPRGDIVLRTLDLPAEVKDNLKEVIRYQVQSLEPTEDERFYYDYAPLNGQPGQKRLSIFLAMVRKSLLDEHLRLLREIDIRPGRVLCSSMGLLNFYLETQKNLRGKTFFMADMSKSELELCVLSDGQFVWSGAQVKNDGQNWAELFLKKANEAIAKLRLNPGSSLEKMVLSGESSREAFAEIQEHIPECELMEKSAQIPATEKTQPLIQESAATIGLALTGITPRPAIQINLLPPDLKRRQSRWAYAVAAVLGAVVLLLLAGLVVSPIIQNSMLLSRLEEENKKLEPAVRSVGDLKKQSENLEARVKLIRDLVNDKDKNLEVLKELTTTFPDNTFLSNYSNQNGSIKLAGQSASSADIILKLGTPSSLLKNVSQVGAISRDQQSGRDRFNLTAKLENNP